MTATTSSGARLRADATTSSGARWRRRQHRLGHRGDDNIVWGTRRRRQHRLGHRRDATTSSGARATTTTSCGARDERRQHRLGHAATATTSCGAPQVAATTSSGARRSDGRQHRLGHGATATTSSGARRRRRQHRVGHVPSDATTSSGARASRQHRLGHQRRRRQHRLGHPRRRQHRVGHRGDDNIVWGTSATPIGGQRTSELADIAGGAASHGKDALPRRDWTLQRPGSMQPVAPTQHGRRQTDWRQALPVLTRRPGRAPRAAASDAPSLFALLTTEEVARFISPPPTTVEGFERFIAWTHRQRAAGSYVCFAVTLRGLRHRDRHLPGARARAGLRHRRVGLCDRLAVLGHGRVHGRRASW